MEDRIKPSNGKKRKRFSEDKKDREAGHPNIEGFATVVPKNELLDEVDNECLSDKGLLWPESLSESQLDLLVSIKQLAVERLTTAKENCLKELLPGPALQAIGVLLEELAKDRMRNLVCAHKLSSQASEASQEHPSTEFREDTTALLPVELDGEITHANGTGG